MTRTTNSCDTIVDDLVALTGTVRRAVASATSALLDADARLAELVIAGDAAIDDETEAIEERALLLLATQQPVATDLRQLVATLRMLADLERMGDLSVHVAKVARMRDARPGRAPAAAPDHPGDGEGRRLDDRRRRRASSPTATSWPPRASRTRTTRWTGCTRTCSAPCSATRGRTASSRPIDLALLGRYYERIGDHAVSMARRVVYLVTGELT